MDPTERAALSSIIAQVLDPEPPRAADRAGEPAAVVCDTCHRFFTWRAVSLVPGACTFRCADCQAVSAARDKRRQVLKVLRSPFFYVAILMVLSMLLYASGMGRLDPQAIVARDAKRPWFDQRLPALHLQQGARIRIHVELLDDTGEREAVRTWAPLAYRTYSRAATLWAGTEAEPLLAAGAAVMRGRAGDPNAAYKQLLQLALAFPPDSESYASYLYYRGTLALRLGHEQAALQDLEAVLRGTGSGRDTLIDLSSLDLLLEADPSKRNAEAMLRQVRTYTGFDLPRGFMARRIVELLKRHNVRSLVANRVEREMKEAGAWNRRQEGPLVETANR